MDWGKGITIVIVTFLIAMFIMVSVAFKQNNELYDTNYYEKEMQYQSIINASQNLNAIYTDSILSISKDYVELTFPKLTFEQYEQGSMELLYRTDQSKDVTVRIKPNDLGKFKMATAEMVIGMYTARIKWTNNGTPYYREQVFKIW